MQSQTETELVRRVDMIIFSLAELTMAGGVLLGLWQLYEVARSEAVGETSALYRD
jgi:hypothetical protein